MRIKNFRASITTIILLLTVLAPQQFNITEAAQIPEQLFARVVKVHDGDTLSVIIYKKKEKVRLTGIDAPEMRQRPWGTIAKKYLNKIFEDSGWSVYIELDIEQRDKYGRLLGYVWTKDGRMANLEMIKGGYAVLYTIPPNLKHTEEFRNAQMAARERGLNIWGKRGLRQMPEDYRKAHPQKRYL